jgi:Cu+-exporting ATPase
VKGASVLAGNTRLLQEHGIAIPELPVESGSTSLHITQAGAYVGTLLCRDALREDAVAALRALGELHLQVVMLTGDTAVAAQPLADTLGIREVYAGLSPEQKLERIRELQQRGARVLMVGDGINDAAAIAQADSGIGMGTGTELAREAGDAILLHSDLSAMVAALRLARATRRIMKQNLGWAAGYNLLAVPLAAGVLFPAFGILLSPAVAAAAMALSSVSVLLNSLRLRRWRAARSRTKRALRRNHRHRTPYPRAMKSWLSPWIPSSRLPPSAGCAALPDRCADSSPWSIRSATAPTSWCRSRPCRRRCVV